MRTNIGYSTFFLLIVKTQIATTCTNHGHNQTPNDGGLQPLRVAVTWLKASRCIFPQQPKKIWTHCLTAPPKQTLLRSKVSLLSPIASVIRLWTLCAHLESLLWSLKPEARPQCLILPGWFFVKLVLMLLRTKKNILTFQHSNFYWLKDWLMILKNSNRSSFYSVNNRTFFTIRHRSTFFPGLAKTTLRITLAKED